LAGAGRKNEIAGGVHRQAQRVSDIGGGGRAAVAEGGGNVAGLPSVGGNDSTGVDLADPKVLIVGEIQVAGRVKHHAERTEELSRSGRASVAGESEGCRV
jgi:hypothetical protein